MYTKKQKKINYFLLICIFGAGVVLHYFYGSFSKSIDVLPDEIRYYSIARSIFQGDGLTFRGVATDYQKMGYTLFLVPFFLIKKGIVRMEAITLANSLLMMSSIFPLYGIMNRFNISNRVKMSFLAVFIFFPDLMYSATFMAEVLYWPILLLFIYLWIINREKRSFVLSIVLGVICYIGYSTKEIFLAVLLSVVVFELLYPILEHITMKTNNRLREYYNKKKIFHMVTIVVSFAIVYLIIKLVFFWGLGNSYDQMGIEEIASTEKFGYMVYGFFYYLASILIACFIIPIVLPAMEYKQLGSKLREVYIFNILCFIMAVATVAYTITVREDYGDIIPRLHFRYIGPLIIVAIIVFIKTLDSKNIDFKMTKSKVVTIVVTLVVSLGLFRGVTVITGVDQFILDWVVILTDTLGDFWGVFLVYVIEVIVVVATTVLLAHRKNNVATISLIIIMIMLGIVNSVTAKDRLVEYMYRDETQVLEAMELNQFLRGVDGGVLYIGEHKSYNDNCKCVDTYIDRNSKLYYVSRKGLSQLDEGIYKTEELTFPMIHNLWKMKYKDIDTIEYVIEDVDNTEDYKVEIENLTLVEDYNGIYYKVYKNNDSRALSINKRE